MGVTQSSAPPNPRNAKPGGTSGNATWLVHCNTSSGLRKGVRVGFKNFLVPVDFTRESKNAD